jgi:hypothetical protein
MRPQSKRRLLGGFFSLLFSQTSLHALQDNFSDDLRTPESNESSSLSGRGTERRIIFLDFQNESNNQEYTYLSRAIGESIYQTTKPKYVYTRIEDSIWKSSTTAARFRPEDFFNRSKIQNLGNTLAVDGIVYGKFVVSPEGIHIYGKILSVLSKEILAETKILIQHSDNIKEKIQAISDILSARLREIFIPLDRSAIWRSALFPGWGQFYKHRKTWGQIYAGAVGTGFAFSLFSLVMWQTAYGRYRNYNPDHVVTPQGGTELIDPAAAQAQFNSYVSQTQTWQQITLVSAGITLAIYAWQILDAWLFDSKHAQLGRRTAALENSTFIGFGGGIVDSPVQNLNYTNHSATFSINMGLHF